MKQILNSIIFTFLFVIAITLSAEILTEVNQLEIQHANHILIDRCIVLLSLKIFLILFFLAGAVTSVIKVVINIFIFFSSWFIDDKPIQTKMKRMKINVEDNIITDGYVEFNDGTKIPLYIKGIAAKKVKEVMEDKKDE